MLADRLYLHGSVDEAGTLGAFCFDAMTGNSIWRSYSGQAPTYQRRVCIGDGKLYYGDLNCMISCFDIEGGDLLWQYQLDKEEDRYLWEMCVGNNKLFVDTQDEYLYCFKAEW